MFRLFLFISFFFSSTLVFCQNESYYKYIENKGQWPEHVLFNCELENGNLFLENKGLKFNFWDNSEYTSLHGNLDQKLEEKKPTLFGHVYEVNFLGHGFNKKTKTNRESKEYFNYYRGNDKTKWASECHSFGEVTLEGVYPGIDFKMHSNDFFLKYDFIVAPRADVSKIQLEYLGQDAIKLDNGRLIISLSVNEIVEQKPLAWQIINDEKVIVKCLYKLKNNVISFDFPNGYNQKHELIIDPELIFSTYSGSTSANFGYTATYDSEGFLYSGSSVFAVSGIYPTTLGAYQSSHAGGDGPGGTFPLGGTDIAISKYDTTGTFMVYSTYLGGSADDLPHSLIVNSEDELYVYGTTSSNNFPITSGAFDSTFAGGSIFPGGGLGVDYLNGSDIIVTKFNSIGTDLIASTFLGGIGNDGVNLSNSLLFNYADEIRGEILLDNNEDVYIVSSTNSIDFPIVNGFQTTLAGGQDGCIVKMNSNLTDIIWSSYLGGNSDDAAYALAIDSNNDIVVTGGTESTNFPATLGSYQTSNSGGTADGYIVKIDQNGTGISAGTYYGSSAYDQLYFIEIDLDDQIYVYGQTLAAGNFFIENANYSQTNSGMLISKFNEGLSSRTWSTVFGTSEGKCNLSPTAFLVDVCNRVYLAGWGGQTNASNPDTDYVDGMDVSDDAFQSTTDGSDFYLLVIDSDANDIVYGSFFGGNESSEHVDGGTSRFSPDGTIYQSVCAGCGGNSDFPTYPSNVVSTTNNSVTPGNNGNCNNAVFKMKFDFPSVSSVFEAPSQYCLNEAIPMINNSEFGTQYTWDFGDGSPLSNEEFPIHTFEDTGTYVIELISYNENCDVTENSFQTITIISEQVSTINNVDLCEGESTIIGPENVFPNYDYLWSPADDLSSSTIANPTASPNENTDYTLVIHHEGCIDTLFQQIEIVSPNITLPDDYLICESQFIDITSIYSLGASINWYNTPDLLTSLSNEDELNVFVDENTNFYATATLQECIDIDTIQITLLSQSVQITPDFTACANDTIQLEIENPNDQLTYHWFPENQILTGQNTTEISSILQQQTTYSVVANYNDLCSVTAEVFVDISDVNSNQISASATPANVLAGQEVQLQGLPNGYTYSWTPSESLNNSSFQNPIATPEENTTYFLTIHDGNCSYYSSVQVKVFDFVCGNPTIYVPNAFTPNNNEENEQIWVRGNNLTSIYFVIYDRWGEKIFETTDQGIGWDGTYEGEELDPAVFVYYLEAVCGDGQEYFEKGNITLIR